MSSRASRGARAGRVPVDSGRPIAGEFPDDPVLAVLVSRLVRAYEPERIYLFGSRARGEAGIDSDYDLMVVVPDDAPPERQRGRLAYEALRGTGTAADVLVWTRRAFDERVHLRSSLPATIVREEKLVPKGATRPLGE